MPASSIIDVIIDAGFLNKPVADMKVVFDLN